MCDLVENEQAGRRRGRFEGMANVVRFNWTLYVVGACAVMAAVLMALWLPIPLWMRWLAWTGAAGAAYLLLASLVVSHWIYDRSRLYAFEWARHWAGDGAKCVVNLHSGFDETSEGLGRVFGDARLIILDFYDRERMTEASIARARLYQAKTAPAWLAPMTRSTRVSALPLKDDEADAVFAILAAHEIREPADRAAFFAQVRRVLRPGGRFILLEHLRDPANFIAFGPQFVHFYSRRTWVDLGRGADLDLVHEERVTPFIGLFVFEKGAE